MKIQNFMKTHLKYIVLGLLIFGLSHTVKAQFGGGLGTSASPYQIGSATHLNNIRTTYLDKYFIQTANITLSGNWDPIGDDADGSRFTGNYNGDVYNISGLTIDRSDEAEVGLFGCIGLGTADNPVVIRNVELINVGNVTGARGTGSLVGRVRGNVYTLIENCSASGTGTLSGNGATGGLVGANNSATETPGGTDNPTLSQSWANIPVEAVAGGNGDKIGGLVGCNQKGNTINCYARGSVTVPSSGTFERIGGLAGCTDLRGTITNSFSTGLVTEGNATRFGGLVGYLGTGGNKGVVTDSYWDTQTSGQSTSASGIGYTTAEMKVQGNFAGFDFTLVWNIDGSTNDGYPYLRNTGVTTYNNWTGATDNSWDDTDNWSATRLPIATDIAVIPSGLTNYPIITSSESFTATAKILDIPLGGSLTINSGGEFTVDGDLRSETTGIIIKSDETGTGSLLHNAERVNATVERYIVDGGWHLITPSTTGVTANDFYWGFAPSSWLAYHTESTNLWTYNTVLSTPMPVGQGWSLWIDDAKMLMPK